MFQVYWLNCSKPTNIDQDIKHRVNVSGSHREMPLRLKPQKDQQYYIGKVIVKAT